MQEQGDREKVDENEEGEEEGCEDDVNNDDDDDDEVLLPPPAAHSPFELVAVAVAVDDADSVQVRSSFI